MKNERDNIVNLDDRRNRTPKYREHGFYEDPISQNKSKVLQEKLAAKNEWASTWGENKELNTTNKLVLVVLSLLIIATGLYTLI